MEDGTTLTVHCPNTGAMLGCQDPDSPIWLSRSSNPKRKHAWTWELVETREGVLVGINTGHTNRIARGGIESGAILELSGYPDVRSEVTVEQGSRLDFLLSGDGGPDCYLEVKNVTAAVAQGVAAFPDAVSKRASRHLEVLQGLLQAGHRSVLLFLIQRMDVDCVRPADEIDPVYGQTLRRAVDHGVQVLAYKCRVSPEGVVVHAPVPVCLD